MKGNIETVSALIEAINRVEATKQDFVMDTRHMRMPDDSTVMLELPEGPERYDVADYASGQISDRLNIPRKFWNKLGDEYNGLRGSLVNGMWAQHPEKRFVRTINDERPRVRAYLSDKYHPLDNMMVMQSLLPTMEQHRDLQVMNQSLTDKKLYMQIVFPRLTGEISVGDVVQGGVTITNSEIGAGAVDIAVLLWQLRCKNGLIGSSIMRKHHVGARIELNDDGEHDIFRDDTIRAEIESLRLRLRDVFAAAMDEAAFQTEIAKLKAATQDTVQDPLVAARNVTQRFELPESAADVIYRDMVYHGDINRYGIVNGLTWYAQQLDNRDQQFDVERTAYSVLDMPRSEWRRIAEDAEVA